MLDIKDGVVTMTRGDDEDIEVTITDGEGMEYEMEDGDTLTLSVRELPDRGGSLIFRAVSDTNVIHISKELTAEHELGKECRTKLIGCSMADLSRVATAHGLEPHGYEMSGDELVKQDRPAIIFWKHNHFVVFCGYDDHGDVVICNPDKGRFPLKESTFLTFYSGIALFNGVPEELPEGSGT